MRRRKGTEFLCSLSEVLAFFARRFCLFFGYSYGRNRDEPRELQNMAKVKFLAPGGQIKDFYFDYAFGPEVHMCVFAFVCLCVCERDKHECLVFVLCLWDQQMTPWQLVFRLRSLIVIAIVRPSPPPTGCDERIGNRAHRTKSTVSARSPSLMACSR